MTKDGRWPSIAVRIFIQLAFNVLLGGCFDDYSTVSSPGIPEDCHIQSSLAQGSKFVVCLKSAESQEGLDPGINLFVGVGVDADIGAFQFTSLCLSTGAKMSWDVSGIGGLAASLDSIISASSSGNLLGIFFGTPGKLPEGAYLLSSLIIPNLNTVCPGGEIKLFGGVVTSSSVEAVDDYCGVSVLGRPCTFQSTTQSVYQQTKCLNIIDSAMESEDMHEDVAVCLDRVDEAVFDIYLGIPNSTISVVGMQFQLVCDLDVETPLSLLNAKFQGGVAEQLGFVTTAGHTGVATVALSMLSLPTENVIKFSRVLAAGSSLATLCPVNFKSTSSGRGIQIKEFQAVGRYQEKYTACGFDFIDKPCTDIGELCDPPPSCENGKFCGTHPPQGVDSEVSLYYEVVDDQSTTLDVWMLSSNQVSGIQFHFTCLENSAVHVEKITGGLFDNQDIQSNIIGNKVMAVSLGSNATEAGWHWLARFNIINPVSCASDEICLSDISAMGVFSQHLSTCGSCDNPCRCEAPSPDLSSNHGYNLSKVPKHLLDICGNRKLIFMEDLNSVVYIGTSENECIFGTKEADVISGKGGSDVIFGLGGGDVIYGNTGNDIIYGGVGNDLLYGQAGNDKVFAGLGSDTIIGGIGSDFIRIGKGSQSPICGNDILVGNNNFNQIVCGV